MVRLTSLHVTSTSLASPHTKQPLLLALARRPAAKLCSPAATLPTPSATVERQPLAVLVSPPTTVAELALAVLLRPPPIVA